MKGSLTTEKPWDATSNGEASNRKPSNKANKPRRFEKFTGFTTNIIYLTVQ